MPLKSTLVLDQISDGANGAPKKYSLRNTYLSAMPGLLFILQVGLVSSYPAPATVDMKQPGSRFRHITADEITWIASLPMVSGVFGNAFSGYATQFFGRKAWLLYSSLISVTGWLTVAYAPSVPFLYVGRILCGFACASNIVTVPTYIVEIAPSKKVEGFQMKDVLDRSFYKPLSIAVALMFFHTFSGMSSVLSYTVDIFQKAGSSVQPNVASHHHCHCPADGDGRQQLSHGPYRSSSSLPRLGSILDSIFSVRRCVQLSRLTEPKHRH
ncbi:hypothetical protein JTE90_017622 [Oedothorax gibbosus]|uniref:Major facilitator superfamily (MFS) profile domain-containing protein n=1 Tax=Oedothorax gibbosus TaxID=931172 RepID=A0AAV6U4F1_9ARAC|nr:hypothetical protein JTE90_017622 [Oedothorax gibbosus]